MKKFIKSSSLVLDLRSTLFDIVDKYNGTSYPVSGDWDTETEAELNDIADALNITKESAKALMIFELGFDESDF